NVDGIDKTFKGSHRFHGAQVGIAIPILPSDHKAKIAASKISEQIATTNYEYQRKVVQGELKKLSYQYNKHTNTLEYYEKSGIPQADLIIKNAERGFRSGDIPYMQYQQSLTLALKIKYDYLDELNFYNQTIITIETFIGIKEN
ncbi:MAG: TolC family protein, partial [Ginsengibacter sp.]